MLKRAIFLDRDGVINENRDDYVKNWHEFIFLPGVFDSIKLIAQTSFLIVVVTNQSAINRGLVDQSVVEAIHLNMVSKISENGGRIDAIYYCPHTPIEGCDCRKPKPGLFVKAAGELNIDLSRSYIIGDKLNDLAAGSAAGCSGLLVLTGEGGGQDLSEVSEKRYPVFENLSAAVTAILEDEKMSINLEDRIFEIFQESADLKLKLSGMRDQINIIADMARMIVEHTLLGGKIILFGNGGSASDAQHIAAELIGRFKLERRAFPAIALTTDSSILTALGNDYSFDLVFSRQVEALANAQDVIIGISTSGTSANVLAGLKEARKKGAKVISLTGKNGNEIKALSDLCVCVPSDDTARIQETHITIGHAICELVEEMLVAQGKNL